MLWEAQHDGLVDELFYTYLAFAASALLRQFRLRAAEHVRTLDGR